MAEPQNRYERLAVQLAEWQERMVDRIAEELMGGKRPPWSVKMTPAMKRAYLSRLTPEEAWSLWQQMEPDEQQEVAQLMNTPEVRP